MMYSYPHQNLKVPHTTFKMKRNQNKILKSYKVEMFVIVYDGFFNILTAKLFCTISFLNTCFPAGRLSQCLFME